MTHDACGEEPRRWDLGGEATRRATRLSGKMAKDVERRLVVFDYSVFSISGIVCDDGTEKRAGGRLQYLVLSRMNVSPHRWYSSLMVHPRKEREMCRNVMMASHFRILLGKSIMSLM